MMTISMTITPRKVVQDKQSLSVKDINDFCRERLYPKEKFLRKN
jgi:hypothetical protein